MRKTLAGLVLGLEEDSSGIVGNEIEYIYYAKLVDSSVLEKATKVEDHEQWNLRVEKSDKHPHEVNMRVRKTVVDDQEEYVLTIKVPQESLQAENNETDTQVLQSPKNMREVAIKVTVDAFDLFKTIAANGMIKKRYVLPIEGTDMSFEVDTFIMKDGSVSEWVKVDLEVKTPINELPKLPEGFTDVIYNQKDQQTKEEKDFVWRLYENVFLTKNTEN